ncbi:response regulator [Chitinibacter bivalviorum]|uniref:Response regulator n=1 Tax=Chitinibacter bivalviorum TaxID=2739434 RepID=A0A7H9BED2_9NEIS|nr:response regulator [Chitinibacter bivalviorum]QLG86979.1 response regulator [Chitinibacter bivalviorum]
MTPALRTGRVLIVDDEPFNLEILSEHLHDAGYETATATDGEDAWEVLQADRKGFDTILLDRMMPRMDGMQVLAKLKQHPDFQHIPVIMQTAVGAAENVQEGLAAGAYYYLIKPFQREMLLAIVAAAVGFHQERGQLEREISEHADSYKLLLNGQFKFRTLDDARQQTLLLSRACPDPQRVALGLSELLVNAVEHGNLGISYSEKTRLLQTGRWLDEVEMRLNDSQYKNRSVLVHFASVEDEVQIRIVDEGAGFDWQPFLEFSPERAFDPHGRGISMARMMSFDSVEYQGRGNEVLVRIRKS